MQGLPAAEKERRWKQHLMSEGGLREAPRARARPAGRNGGNIITDAANWVDRKFLKAIPKGTFADVGSKVGSVMGLGALGGEAGALLAQITGRGAYEVKRNSILQGGDMVPSGLSFSPSGAAGIRVRKREFIKSIKSPTDGDIGAGTPFTLETFRLQSTDRATFPWLAQISEHFTEWELKGCVFSYETTSSNYSQSMALGTVALATQYNANESSYVSMEEILAAAYHSRGNPAESIMHGIECDPALQSSEHLFTRRPETSGPPNLYDHGVVTIATEGLPYASRDQIIGRLYVTYDIELSLPVLPNPQLWNGQQALWWTAASAANGPPLGAFVSITKYDDMGIKTGAAADNNLIVMSPSPAPHARPLSAGIGGSTLLGWMSDNSTASTDQWIYFTAPGMYVVEATYQDPTGTAIADLASVTPMTNHATVRRQYNTTLLTSAARSFHWQLETSSPDQGFRFRRDASQVVSIWVTVTFCGKVS